MTFMELGAGAAHDHREIGHCTVQPRDLWWTRAGGVSVGPSSRASPAPTVGRPTGIERTASGMSVQ